MHSSKVTFEPIAIIGVGGLFPQSEDTRQYWSMLKTGKDAITEIPPTHWRIGDYFDVDPKRPDHTYAKRGGFLQPFAFNPLAYGITPNALEATDTSQLLAMVAAQDALRDAGYEDENSYNRDRVSVILGVTGALELVIPLGARLGHPRWRKALLDAGIPADIAEDVVERISASYPPWSEASFPGLLGNVVAGRVANRLDLGGTNCVVDAACASSLSALHLACMELQAGHADLVLSGGVDTFNDIFMFMCFSKTPALSATGDARPFDAEGDGTILGEGVGMVALKRLADAQRDGDRVYAVVKGMGSSSDGRGRAIYAPSSEGQAKALRRAYANADITPQTIELVEAHGTGTKVGDATEIQGLVSVFGDAAPEQAPWCALGSVKSQIGHTKAAAGIASLIKLSLALYRKLFPPSIKVHQPLPILKQPHTPLYLNTQLRPWLSKADHPRRAALSALGFGGSNFHCVLEEATPLPPTTPDWDGRVQLIAFSADSYSELQKYVQDWKTPQTWTQLCEEAIRLRATFRSEAAHRLLWVCEAYQPRWRELQEAASKALARQQGTTHWSTPEGISYGSGAWQGKLAWIVPGQGCQYTGMLRDIICHFPESFSVFEHAQAAFQKHAEPKTPLDRLVFPIPAWSDDERTQQEDALRSTDVAQPALGAVSLAAARALQRFGIKADLLAGHSYGELVALHLAEVYDQDALFALSHKRGALMAQGGDRGTMLAVQAPLEQIEAFVREEAPTLVLANQNSPTQAVLSGSFADIDAAEKRLEARKIRARRIPVAAAFHSTLVADAQAPFLEKLQSIDWKTPQVTVFANKTATPYPKKAEEGQDLLASQLASPVRFVDQIKAMADAGAKVFLELGPGARMTRLIEAILEGHQGIDAFSMDASQGKRDGLRDFGMALTRLAAHGYPVQLASWDPIASARPIEKTKKPAMQVMISGANVFTSKREIPVSSPLQLAKTNIVNTPALEKAPLQASSTRSTTPRSIPQPTPAQAAPKATQIQQRVFTKAPETPIPPNFFTPPTNPSAQPIIPPSVPTPFLQSPLAKPLPSPNFPPHAPRPSFPLSSQGTRAMSDDLLQMSQQTLYQLLLLQQQTAQLHQQFLEGQQQARQIFYQMWLQQGNAPLNTEAQHTLQPQAPVPTALYASFQGQQQPPAAWAPPTLPSTPAWAPPQAPNTPAWTPSPQPTAAMPTAPQAQITRQPSAPPVYGGQGNTGSYVPNGNGAGNGHGGHHQNGGSTASMQASLPVVATVSTPTHSSLPAVAPSTTNNETSLQESLFAVVSEKTGYPVEILEAEMELDADLGIDSIKRVEILSALQEAQPSLPHLSSQALGSLRTLGDIVRELNKFTQSQATPSPQAKVVTQTTQGPTHGSHGASIEVLRTQLFAVVSEKTGYPIEILEAEMELDADLGIDSIKRVEILSALQEAQPSLPHLSSQALGSLRTLGDIVKALAETLGDAGSSPTSPTQGQGGPAPVDPSWGAELTRWPAQLQRQILTTLPFDLSGPKQHNLPQQGLFLIAADTDHLAIALAEEATRRGARCEVHPIAQMASIIERQEQLCGVLLVAPFQDEQDCFQALAVAKAAAPKLLQSAEQHPFFATISRMDGFFGRQEAYKDPESGALAGLTKTAALEWPKVHCRALDLSPDHPFDASEIWKALLIQGPVELGGNPRGWVQLQLEEAPLQATQPSLDAASFQSSLPVHQGDLVVVTGGARGVTASVALALAKASRPTLLLLGRSPLPEAEAPWLRELQGEAALKKALLQRATQKLGPRDLQKQCDAILRAREVHQNLDAMRKAGARVLYHSVDISDKEAVKRLLSSIQETEGPVRGIIHGAGVLADRLIAEKHLEEAAKVYKTKLHGLYALLEAVGEQSLRFLSLFSSSTARFGRIGQADYAMANEALNKIAQQLSRRMTHCTIRSMNWGPWDGGMVNDSLKQLFAREGVGVIGLQEGALCMLQELSPLMQSSQQSGPFDDIEVVILGRLDGVAPSAPPPKPSSSPRNAPRRVDGKASPQPTEAKECIFQRTLDLQSHGFLRDHAMRGKGVLPAALMVEWMVTAGTQRFPNLDVIGVEQMDIRKGLTISPEKKEDASIFLGDLLQDDQGLALSATLESQVAEKRQIHAQALLRLASRFPLPPAPKENSPQRPLGFAPYEHLFHGPTFHCIEAVDGCDAIGIAARLKAAPPPHLWMHKPPRETWLLDPFWLDGAFQMIILWSIAQHGFPCLPTGFEKLERFGTWTPNTPTIARIHMHNSTLPTLRATIEILDPQDKLLLRVEEARSIADPSLRETFQSQSPNPH